MNSLFGDWKWKNPFATIQRPNPQDFITRGAVTTPGVSVNPHAGFEFKPVYTPEGQPSGIVPYSPPPALGQSDAPTYEKREKDTFDEYTYKKLQEEYENQKQILAAQRQQFAELAAGSGTPQPRGAGSVNVGSRGPIQINPLNPVAQIKQPEILTGPFLGRWRR